jgi:hypothetical protein
MKSNRLMRTFARTYKLVYVQFRGEEGQYYYDNATFQGRFKAIIDEGNMGYVKYILFIIDLCIHVYMNIHIYIYECI